MIISSLMNLIYNIFQMLLSSIHVEAFPEGSVDSISSLLEDLFLSTESIIGILIPEFCFVFLGLVISIELCIHTYQFIMWILRKIPMLGIN